MSNENDSELHVALSLCERIAMPQESLLHRIEPVCCYPLAEREGYISVAENPSVRFPRV